MPQRSFGRTVRYRRTKLGLSQAKLGELVGRSAGTIRSWERDKTQPNEAKVITALAAILGIDERALFEKAGQEVPDVEASPTIEQALATLDPELAEGTTFGKESESDVVPEEVAREESVPVDENDDASVEAPAYEEPTPAPAYATPPQPYAVTTATPPVHEPSYMEDNSQRQLYRVRNLATLVVLVALVVALVWALGEGLGALGDWWDDFFGNLRL